MKINDFMEILFIALLANIGEFILGWLIRFITGDFLWVYPNSFLITTSIYAYPLWIMGLITIREIIKIIKSRFKRG